jgi:hypothetical protein
MPPSPDITWIERVVASRGVRASYASVIAHVLALITLALLLVPGERISRPRPILLSLAEAEAPGDAAGDASAQQDVIVAAAPGPAAVEEQTPPVDPPPLPPVTVAGPTVAPTAAPVSAIAAIPLPDAAAPVGGSTGVAVIASPSGGGSGQGRNAYDGRRGDARADGNRRRGGSAASEAAVDRGLAWLARHQANDGSWRFDLSGCQCDGGCRDAGSLASTTAATGIALLAFLGAGQTHEEGGYRETVTRGLYYLMSRMQPTPRGGDLCEGTLYGHGVATLALAEALGMTGDAALAPYVRDAVRFIETSQDLHGGGWRYLPRQPGDTTVTAWQLAALKSAELAGIAVPSPTIDGVCRFLDRVQTRRGEAYGYQAPQARPCTSAIGLLCRLYTHWPNEDAVDRGLATLARPGPDPDAVYLNFYLAQALLQRDHPAWSRWNARNRDQLVARQAAIGHEAGSWFFADRDTAPGGRLAHTALAVLTLEVYYRLLPIYRPDAVAARW